MRRVFWAALAWVVSGAVGATADPLYPSFNAFLAEIDRIEAIADPTQRTGELDTFWNGLKSAGQVPYVQGNQAAMLYRGAASSVTFPGDANRWNANAWSATQVPGTDLWLRQSTLPSDARVDYKIVRNGQWILDPNNPLQQWSGFGPNSELRMEEYEFPAETVLGAGVARGSLSGNQRLSSSAINADVNVRVYTPSGYDQHQDLPVVYVTDGHEYLDNRLGSMATVLDNLIGDGRLQPTIAVFIDPRDPRTGVNRRASQLGGSGKGAFADFIADELVPTIDAGYRTDASADKRVILGTSLGGLFSAYMGARHPDVVSNAAIQSPAFWYDDSIYSTYFNSTTLDDQLRIYMESGTINDGNGGPTMATILADGGYDYVYDAVNQGHSWGHWKGELDAALIHLIGPEAFAGDADQDGDVDVSDLLRWQQSGDAAGISEWRNAFDGGSAQSAVRAVPEPGSGGVALIGAGCFIRRPARCYRNLRCTNR
ncbi:MAG: alpha/beta hydrolase-fold protein [Planctomycetota bacterium]